MTTTISAPNDSATAAPVMRIDGHVDPSTGNINAPGALHVRGNIVDMFQVTCAGDAMIEGVIEAAEVTVGRDLHANGGIAGKGRGMCRIAGNVQARYIAQATVECRGDLSVQAEILSSRIIVGGNASIPTGALMGGHATIVGSLACQTIGGPGTSTIVEIGFDEPLRRLAAASLPRIERLTRDAEKVRTALAPLMKNQKHLTREQKEKVTEMLFEADSFDEEVEALRTPLELGWQALLGKPESEIIVSAALHPGVTIRFRGVQTTITAAIKGPVRLRVRGSGHDLYVSLVEDGKQAGHALSSRPLADPVMDQLAKLFGSKL